MLLKRAQTDVTASEKLNFLSNFKSCPRFFAPKTN